MRSHPATMRMLSSLLLTIVGATAASLPAAGASVDAKPLPVTTWRKVANDICRQGQILSDEIADEVFADLPQDAQPSLDSMTTFIQQLEPVFQQQIDSIDALEEPTSLRKKVKKLLATAQEELDAVVDDPALGVEANPFSATELAAKKLKLKQCA